MQGGHKKLPKNSVSTCDFGKMCHNLSLYFSWTKDGGGALATGGQDFSLLILSPSLESSLADRGQAFITDKTLGR